MTVDAARELQGVASVKAPSPKEPRILELDGIRGVAVLTVVLFHYTIIGPGAYGEPDADSGPAVKSRTRWDR